MKNTKARVVIAALILVVVVGAVAGIMAFAGVFTSGKTEALELLLQAEDKFLKSSAGEYVGSKEISTAFSENGGSVDLKCSNVQFDASAQSSMMGSFLLGLTDWSEFVLELNTQFDMDSERTSSSIAVSKGDGRISATICAGEDEEWVSLPELLDGKVFHITSEEREKFLEENQQIYNMEQPTEKEILELFSELKSYVADQIIRIQGDITCEKIAKKNLESKGDKGYTLLIPSDTIQSFLTGFSDILSEQENENFRTLGEITADWSVSQDIEMKVYAENDSLSRIEASVGTSGEVYQIVLAFSEEDEKSSASLTVSGNVSDVPVSLTVERTDSSGEKYDTATGITLLADDEQVLDMNWEETVTPGSDTYAMKGAFSWLGENSFGIEANGTIKDLKQGVCASYILDDVKILADGTEVAALSMELSVSSRDASLEPPQGEIIELTSDMTDEVMEQYTEELQSQLVGILSKMGLSSGLLLGGLTA